MLKLVTSNIRSLPAKQKKKKNKLFSASEKVKGKPLRRGSAREIEGFWRHLGEGEERKRSSF